METINKVNLNLDLRSHIADDILDQFSDDWSYDHLDVFPNLPLVKDMVMPYIIQENHFWIITFDIPLGIYEKLELMDLVPHSDYNDTIENLSRTYYNK